jgi:hypothetical protein
LILWVLVIFVECPMEDTYWSSIKWISYKDNHRIYRYLSCYFISNCNLLVWLIMNLSRTYCGKREGCSLYELFGFNVRFLIIWDFLVGWFFYSLLVLSILFNTKILKYKLKMNNVFKTHNYSLAHAFNPRFNLTKNSHPTFKRKQHRTFPSK